MKPLDASPLPVPAASTIHGQLRRWLYLLCWLLPWLGGCAALPPLEPRTVSTRLTDTAETRLGRAIVPMVAEQSGRSGVYALSDGRDAFAARVLLANLAERSLDVQYYIWHVDLSGTLLLDAVRRAADRGVRVRLLLDDNNTSGMDDTLAALAAHPNIEVRLFNPFVLRRARWLGYLTDFERLNRRMHNKSFTADNQATIVGGRNVGDEYFGAGSGFLFVDLDVIAIGPVVDAVSKDFDRYWASGSAYPATRLVRPIAGSSAAMLDRILEPVVDAPEAKAYRDAIKNSAFFADMAERRLRLDWAPVHLFSDDPAKGLGTADPAGLLWTKLRAFVGDPTRELDIASAYFVPGAEGTADLARMARQGVDVNILTNSLEATDVAAVHAGYAKRREPLLRAGVHLYEMKRSANSPSAARSLTTVGSSASSLHAKTFSVDDRYLFIGSFNFDPRSARLNTEMGFVIESAPMAIRMEAMLRRELDGLVYRVRLGDDGGLEWVETVDGREVVHRSEPGASVWKRLAVDVLSFLPIEDLL